MAFLLVPVKAVTGLLWVSAEPGRRRAVAGHAAAGWRDWGGSGQHCPLLPPPAVALRGEEEGGVEHACARCQDQTGALHMFYDTNESESCLVKAPAKHASESVLVVGELLCTGVQANTERHTRKETREMCSCWGYERHSSSRKSGEWRGSNFQQSSRLANLGS